MRPLPFPLWPSLPPGALGSDPDRDIPTLTAYIAPSANATGAAVIVCPGGGYSELMDYEGHDFALWLNERGVTAFVLKYRLASHGYHHPDITNDITRAVRSVRSEAQKWGVDPSRIGVMGSSAGGHLASFAMTHFDAGNPCHPDPVERVSSRPDFGILCYSVISMQLSRFKSILGPDADEDLVRLLSSDLQVTSETPPCFLWHTYEDATVSVDHPLRFARALAAHAIPFSLHIYPNGEHSLGLGVKGYIPGTHSDLHPWTAELDRWLAAKGAVVG